MANENDSLSSLYDAYIKSLPQQTFEKGALDREDVDYYSKESPTGRDENWRFWRNRKVKEDPLVTGYSYVFMTAPELPISRTGIALAGFNSDSKTSKDADMILETNERMLSLPGNNNVSIYSPEIIKMLSGEKSAFIPLISNRALSHPTSDEVLNTIDYSETWNRYKIVLGTTAKDSRISGNFTVSYLEDGHLTMMKIHRLWLEYIEKVFMGDCLTGSYLLNADMMDNSKRVIDYMTSMYVFTVQPDGETLTHWCRYTGCFPTKVPWSELTSEDGNIDIKKSIPIEYQFSYKEDMNPYILQDFNLLSSSGTPDSPTGNNFTGSGVLKLNGANSPLYPGIVDYKYNEFNQKVTKDIFTGMPIFRLVFPDPKQ